MDSLDPPCDPIIAPRALARRLQTLRLRAGWKLEEVADRAGVSRSTLYHLERGATPHPRAATVHRLAEAYGVTVEFLIGVAESATERGDCGGGAIRADMHEDWNGRARDRAHPGSSTSAACRFDRATNPAVELVAASDPQLFAGWSSGDWEELYSNFATGGALNDEGVREVAGQINRHRQTLQRLRIVLHTHLAEVAAEMVDVLFRTVSPQEVAAGDFERPERVGVNRVAAAGCRESRGRFGEGLSGFGGVSGGPGG